MAISQHLEQQLSHRFAEGDASRVIEYQQFIAMKSSEQPSENRLLTRLYEFVNQAIRADFVRSIQQYPVIKNPCFY